MITLGISTKSYKMCHLLANSNGLLELESTATLCFDSFSDLLAIQDIVLVSKRFTTPVSKFQRTWFYVKNGRQ
jgi:hypothetical protein